MTITAISFFKTYDEDTYSKSEHQLIENKIETAEKDLGKIVGLVKSIEYHCNWCQFECECGFENDDQDKYCRECGEPLKFDCLYPEYTQYSTTTAQTEEMARQIFAESHQVKDTTEINVIKYIKITAFNNEDSYSEAKNAQEKKLTGYHD